MSYGFKDKDFDLFERKVIFLPVGLFSREAKNKKINRNDGDVLFLLL